jgi:hypothetical protein
MFPGIKIMQVSLHDETVKSNAVYAMENIEMAI